MILMIINFVPHNYTKASDKIYFAKVQSTGVEFCESPSTTSSLFEIPYSYFVEVESRIDNFYRVKYKGLEGYVEKNKVTLMDGIPQNPYPQVTFQLFDSQNMYLSADRGTVVEELDETAVLTYYGQKVGRELKTGNNIWYYANIEKEGRNSFGYIYTAYIDSLPHIEANTENFEILTEDIFAPPSSFSGLSTGTKVILIIAISVPSLLILYFLIKPSKIMQSSKSQHKAKKSKKRVSHGDYFEFDENEL